MQRKQLFSSVCSASAISQFYEQICGVEEPATIGRQACRMLGHPCATQMLGTLAIEERSRSNVTCVLVILCYLTFSIYPQVSGPDDLDEETSLSSTCCAATAETTARLKTYSGKMVPKLLSMCVRCQISKDCYCTLIQFNATLRLSRASRAPRPDCFPKVQSVAGGHQRNPQEPSWGF